MTILGEDEKANIFSKLTYSYFNKLLSVGWKKSLSDEDLYPLGTRSTAEYLNKKFKESWKRQRDKSNNNPNIYKALWPLCGWEFVWSAIFAFIGYEINVVSPLVMRSIIAWIEMKAANLNPPLWQGYVLAVVLFLLQILQSLFLNVAFEKAMRTGVWLRTALVSAVYEKSLKLSNKARQEFTAGKVTNIMSSDISRLDMGMYLINYIWVAPLQILTAFAFLIWQLGWAALVGLGIILISAPIQYKASISLGAFRKTASVISDKRIKVTQEILSGIKVVKLYAWETSVLNQLNLLRGDELKYIKSIHVIRAAVAGFLQTMPIIAAIVTFVIYEVLGNQLTVEKAFTCLAFFYVIRIPLLVYPSIVAQVVDSIVALKRIRELLMAEELNENEPKRDFSKDKSDAIVVNGSFSWENNGIVSGKEEEESQEELVKDEEKKVFKGLLDINFKAPKGSLVAIVGAVGSGKSSLLNAIIGEMKRTGGEEVHVAGTMAYCSQSAWIQNMTLRDNILFGSELDEDRYHQTLKSCALESDLEILAAGDMTEIGERGINLSGGQKARVNLARAVYSKAEILLLDDPLSAVDAHVGTHLFDECILKHLEGRTRVLVTHRLHVLPKVDWILLMDNGRIAEQGTYNDLIKNKDGLLSVLMSSIHTGNSDDASQKTAAVKGVEKKLANAPAILKQNNIIVKEERETGQVTLEVYAKYIILCGGWLVFGGICFIMILAQGSRIVNDLWLNWWVTDAFQFPSEQLYEIIYGVLGVIQAIFMVIAGVLFVLASMRASNVVHQQALEAILRCPMQWFDSQPLGRVINRFSKDMDTIDSLLVEAFRVFFYTFSMTLSIFLLIAVIFPWFIIPLVPTVVVIWLIQKYYRRSSVELKRLDNVTRSPLFAHFGETLNGGGLATIRAYSAQTRFCERTKYLLDYNNTPYYLSQIMQRWLSLRLECLAGFLIFFVALLGIIFADRPEAALIGLAITYALQVTFVFNWCIKQLAEMEMYMSSVERLKSYIDSLPSEIKPELAADEVKEIELKNVVVDGNWPSKGGIKINKVFLRYRDDLEDVLRGVSFQVQPGQKVGIVGRTGAGKSSLINALFLLTPIREGSILIDDVDIQEQLTLEQLRSRLSIIPQDPVVFSGTLRNNLDPFGKHSDKELWDCLEQIGLDRVIEKSIGLETVVSEGGENWSTGQRQLICLARAMLRKSKILVLDEATASVDIATDQMIQISLRNHFNGCTILTIAHRLNTILDYDQIVVLSAGQVVEIGSPKELLSNRDGVFYKMALDQDALQDHKS